MNFKPGDRVRYRSRVDDTISLTGTVNRTISPKFVHIIVDAREKSPSHGITVHKHTLTALETA